MAVEARESLRYPIGGLFVMPLVPSRPLAAAGLGAPCGHPCCKRLDASHPEHVLIGGTDHGSRTRLQESDYRMPEAADHGDRKLGRLSLYEISGTDRDIRLPFAPGPALDDSGSAARVVASCDDISIGEFLAGKVRMGGIQALADECAQVIALLDLTDSSHGPHRQHGEHDDMKDLH